MLISLKTTRPISIFFHQKKRNYYLGGGEKAYKKTFMQKYSSNQRSRLQSKIILFLKAKLDTAGSKTHWTVKEDIDAALMASSISQV